MQSCRTCCAPTHVLSLCLNKTETLLHLSNHTKFGLKHSPYRNTPVNSINNLIIHVSKYSYRERCVYEPAERDWLATSQANRAKCV